MLKKWYHYELDTHSPTTVPFYSCPIGVSADPCPAGAPWMREGSTKFIPITPYTRVAKKKLL